MGDNGKVTRAKLSDIKTDPNNANLHTERGQYMVRRSMERFGFAEAGTLDKNNILIGGELRTETAADVLDADEAIILDVDGKTPVYIRRSDLDVNDPDTVELAIILNRAPQTSVNFDPKRLGAAMEMGIDLSASFFDFELEELGVASVLAPDDEEMTAEKLLDFIELPLPEGVPDTLWPTDNEWGIPLLDISRQADAFDLPIETWGAKARGTKAGTLHFYTEDSRFNAIWQNPAHVLKAQAINVVEPNFSVYDQVPRAVALWQTYKKRWLARYWQSQDVRIFVDLNVARPYDDLNMLGVPRGWQAYATRGYQSRLQALDEELLIAKTHADFDSVTFMVYGGGSMVRDWCADNGATWIPEDMDRAKGKYLENMEKLEDG